MFQIMINEMKLINSMQSSSWQELNCSICTGKEENICLTLEHKSHHQVIMWNYSLSKCLQAVLTELLQPSQIIP